MTSRPVFVLFISLMLADLAYSIPKLERRPVQKHKPGKKSMRQGLAASVEDPDLAVGNDRGIDYQNNIQHVADDLYQSFGQKEDLQETVVRDVDAYAGQEYMEGNDYENDNLGVGDEQNGDFYDANGNGGDLGNVVDARNEEMQTPPLQNYDDYNDNEMRNYRTRALQAGDIFTAQEMLPIAKKLMKKVPSNGSGKGIISSAFNPKDLADTLFARFFLVMKRIVVLEEKDIPGLDALQALALSGEELRSSANSITESPANKRGEHLLEESPIRKSHYKLLRKRVYANRKRRNPKRRLRVNIANKLHRNRKVVVNPGRRGIVKNKDTQNKKGLTRYLNKPNNRLSNRGNLERKRIARGRYNKGLMRKKQVEPKSKNTCRWMYKCTDMSNLDTCRLHTDCSEQGKYDGRYIGIKLNDDEHTVQLKQFRRAISIDVIDEEVEKILENRYKTLRPQNLKSDEKIESLADYFNNIVVREQLEGYYSSPHPMAADADLSDRDEIATEAYNANAQDDNQKDNLADAELQQDGNPQVQPEGNQGIADESTQEAGTADAAISADGEVEPALGGARLADVTLYDEVAPASENAAEQNAAIYYDVVAPPPEDAETPVSPDEAKVSAQDMPIPDEGNHATEVLEAKRRILPGIIKTTT